MKKLYLLIVYAILQLSINTNLQGQSIQTISWQKCVGGSSWDHTKHYTEQFTYNSYIHQTKDEGFIIAGETLSNDYYSVSNHGYKDILVVKLKKDGSKEWNACLGYKQNEYVYDIEETFDGGYIILGKTESLEANRYHKGTASNSDIWIVKLNEDGSINWNVSIGGGSEDTPTDIIQSRDGGYLVVGSTESNDGDATSNHSHNVFDGFLVKLSANGTVDYSRCFGGVNNDFFNSIQETSDGGYIIGGTTESFDGDVVNKHQNRLIINQDIWIVKLKSDLSLEWSRCLGGIDHEDFGSVKETKDNGYVMVGTTESFDGESVSNHDQVAKIGDGLLIKLDANGNVSYSQCLGGKDPDHLYSIKLSTDGGYIIGGESYSKDGDLKDRKYSGHIWIVKLNSDLTSNWSTNIGGTSGGDILMSFNETIDEGYIVGAHTSSTDEDAVDNHGDIDELIVKLNPDGAKAWTKCLGGSDRDYLTSIQETYYGQYIIIGDTYSFDGDIRGEHMGGLPSLTDIWVVRLFDFPILSLETSHSGIQIYPTYQIQDKLQIKSTTSNLIGVIEIMDILGNKHLTKSINLTEINTIDVNKFPKGMYIVNIKDKEGKLVHQQRLMKEE